MGFSKSAKLSWVSPLDCANDDLARSQLFAISAKECGAWLATCSPYSSIGSVVGWWCHTCGHGLSLGWNLCYLHSCQHCRADVDTFDLHGLSCKKSEGRYCCHSVINDIVHHAVFCSGAFKIGTIRSLTFWRYSCTCKHLDGVTIVPWKNGKPLTLDATYLDTLAQSYCAHATQWHRSGGWNGWGKEVAEVQLPCPN